MANYSLSPVDEPPEAAKGYTLTQVDDPNEQIPKPFMDRFLRGDALMRAADPFIAMAKGAGEAFGNSPLGMSDEHVQQMRDAGVFPDPATGRAGALRYTNEAITRQASVLGDLALRGGSAVVGALSEGLKQFTTDADGALGDPERAKEEATNFLNYQMLRGDHQFGRFEHGPGGPTDQPIGVLPKEADFAAATAQLTKLRLQGTVTAADHEAITQASAQVRAMGLQPPFAVPVVSEQSLRLTAERDTLQKRSAEIDKTVAALPPGDATAADRLTRLQQVDQQLSQVTNRTDEAALNEHRDQLLSGTTREELKAAADPIEKRQAAQVEQANINARLTDIEKQLPPTGDPNVLMGQASIVRNNLDDLWQERGIHPAEAVHDAGWDAFLLHELTTRPYNLTDHSGIAPTEGSFVPAGTPRSELARTGDDQIDRVLDAAEVRDAVDNPAVDRNKDVPYSAGPNKTGNGLNIDKHFPQRFMVDGVTFDPAHPFAIHEFVERHVINVLTKDNHQPPARGMTRLYRGETAGGPAGEIPDYVKETPQFKATVEATGRWFTASKAEAEHYAAVHGGPGNKISYVDVPTKDVETYLSKNQSDAKKFSAEGRENTEYFLPKDIATSRQEFRSMTNDQAYRVAHFEFAEKAEAAWYRAHGIDPAHAEAAYKPFIDAIDHEHPIDPPPDLYEKPYPHSNDKAPGSVEDTPPTKAEIYRAHDILTDFEEARAAKFDPEEGEGTIRSLSAAAATDVPSFEKQPPSQPGRLVAQAVRAIDNQLGLARSVQEMLDPMSVGSDRSMVVAKDAMNLVRRIRFEHRQWDAEIGRRFSLEQQERMWNALDEESVLLQEGKTSDNLGLATLTQEERLFVEAAMDPSKAAWKHALDAGMVEGDGLPAYTPRIGINIGLGAEQGVGPQALNQLGRNVFTRTAQMLHRKHLMAEDTEAAMKAIVQKRMEAAGASAEEIAAAVEKVKIVRSIRTLPLATARLEEAVVWRNMINQIEAMGKATGQDVVMVGKKPQGWFTIEGHPAFTKWEPRMEVADTEEYRDAYEKNAGIPIENKKIALVDRNGDVVFDPKPIYIHPEFRGPLSAILDEYTNPVYGAMMSVKGKTMTMIMNSPLVHNEVVFGKALEAAGGNPIVATGLYFRGNRMIRANPQRAAQLVERGLNWIGPRGSIQEISGEQEGVNLEAGRSITSRLLAAVPGLWSEGAEQATLRGIDRLGDFVHNTLLWDRVRDLQFGLADHLSDSLAAKGLDRIAADRIATHFSNLIVGSIPKEAMGAGARAFANLTLFSRSYTLGNLAVFKQAAMGLPKPILAQIARDMGPQRELFFEKDPVTGEYNMKGEDAGEATSAQQQAISDMTTQWSKKLSRNKAITTIAMSVGMYYIGNALLQHAFNILGKDQTVSQEMNGYAKRYASFMSDVKENPWELRHILSRLSPTYDNEPNKGDRIHIGNAADGSAIYGRNLVGKFGEELVGYPSKPGDMLRSKLNPPLGAFVDVLMNDQGFGRKVFDPNGSTLDWAINIGKHYVMRSLPENQIQGAMDLLRGEGDPTVNKYRAFGPMFGFTTSKGAPSAEKGEAYNIRDQFETRMNLAWPDIKRQVLRGDVDGARRAMQSLGAPPWLVNARIRSAQNPSAPLHGRSLQDIRQEATPEQLRRLSTGAQQ